MEKGNQIYFENSSGEIIDERVKELTTEEIEKLLGYKIKNKRRIVMKKVSLKKGLSILGYEIVQYHYSPFLFF